MFAGSLVRPIGGNLPDRIGGIKSLSVVYVAAALALALPYAFFLGGLLITPDAPLAASWAAALYFLHRALVSLDARAWVGVGVALGVGMLSKYTIALLGPAALLFCLADARARAWFRRPHPYAAVLLAALLFAPVVWWNHTHDWASFRFQGGERFVEPARFQLHVSLEFFSPSAWRFLRERPQPPPAAPSREPSPWPVVA